MLVALVAVVAVLRLQSESLPFWKTFCKLTFYAKKS